MTDYEALERAMKCLYGAATLPGLTDDERRHIYDVAEGLAPVCNRIGVEDGEGMDDLCPDRRTMEALRQLAIEILHGTGPTN